MPIRPDLRKFYRGAWVQVRARILERARGKCEHCGVLDRSRVLRGDRIVLIVLTVAHLNHVSGDDRDDNLAALCQRCHLRYDMAHHKLTRCARKDAGRPLLEGL